MRGILLISHGQFAEGLLDSVKMIAGDSTSNVYTCCLQRQDGPEQFKAKLAALQPELNKYDNILVFADLFGGSPCNATFSEFVGNEKYQFITGMNFPMLLTAILSPEETVDNLMAAGREGIADVRAMMASMGASDDE